MKAMERHLLNLTEECDVYSIFSKGLSSPESQMISLALLRIPPPKYFKSEGSHSTFTILHYGTKLSSLIDPKTQFLFHDLELAPNE